jgi:L-lactate dehydrogenase complex protein LldF
MTVRVGESAQAPSFQKAALPLLDDAQLRKNVRHATDVIQRKRGLVVAEQTDWQELRSAASAIKRHTMAHLDEYLVQFEERFTAAGGVVHWATDADEANRIVLGLAQQYGGKEVIKIKTMTSDETGLNKALEAGGVCIVESEGNGRMCLTMPDVLISLVGIEKVIPSFQDLEVFLQLLPRSATGERMNPYNSVWTGTHRGDGPKHFHVVLLDNGRTGILADKEARQTLHCIRCAACLNTCPVYRQTGGHAYGSSYAGPIGAIFTPQVLNMQHAQSLPYASSLCGACYEVCPVKINIPEVLIHLRGRVVREQKSAVDPEALGMKAMAAVFASRTRFEAAQRLARVGQWPVVSNGWVRHLPGMLGQWTSVRDLKAIPDEPFREWWKARQKKQEKQA